MGQTVEVHLRATDVPLFLAMHRAGHEPDDLGAEEWVTEYRSRGEHEPPYDCDHCHDTGVICDNGRERDCPECRR